MKKLSLVVSIVAGFAFLLSIASCKGNVKTEPSVKDTIPVATSTGYAPSVISSFNLRSGIILDSAEIPAFFARYPALRKYEKDVMKMYRGREYNYVWFDKQGMIEQADFLFSALNDLPEHGVTDTIPYLSKFREIMESPDRHSPGYAASPETELLLSSGYIDYVKKTVVTLDAQTAKNIDWNLPRKQLSYGEMLDSLLTSTSLESIQQKTNIRMYYQLKDYLKKYRDLELKGGWSKISWPSGVKSLRPGDSSSIIPQIRERLAFTGDLNNNNKSNLYDAELAHAMLLYKKRNGNKPDSLITAAHISEMNVPLQKRIEQIIVNMERCRWIPLIPGDATFILVNIPEFGLHYIKNGKTFFESDVVVGKPATKTVIFSGDLKYVVFSPYWYVPPSIINKEVKPGMARNKNYLASHNMEWNGGNVRQKPGPSNSLGLVKFLFPNSNNIYLHDSPSKPLFKEEVRAFSHGCIRVAKPKEFAEAILADDPNWNSEKIDKAMHAGTEQFYTIKKTIPVYIAYFTAWVDNEGILNFRKDIYARDDRLASMIIKK